MGCASSAPLVQQGLDAAKKAMSREKDQMESKSKDIAESTAGAANSMMDSVVHAKDEAVEKLQGKSFEMGDIISVFDRKQFFLLG